MRLADVICREAQKYKKRLTFTSYLCHHSEELAKALLNRGYGQFRFLGSGVYAVTFDIGNGAILRMSYEKPRVFPAEYPFNQRIGNPFKFGKDTDICFEIYEKLDILGKMDRNKCIDSAYLEKLLTKYDKFKRTWGGKYTGESETIWDIHMNNVGVTRTGELLITDPGCLRTGRKARIHVIV